MLTAHPDVLLGISAVERAESEVEDFGLDVLGFGGVDRFAEFLDQQFQEFRPGALQYFAKRLGPDWRIDLIPELGREYVDRRVRVFFAKMQADAGTRTPDPFITSEVLYQLSYVGASTQDTGAHRPGSPPPPGACSTRRPACGSAGLP